MQKLYAIYHGIETIYHMMCSSFNSYSIRTLIACEFSFINIYRLLSAFHRKGKSIPII